MKRKVIMYKTENDKVIISRTDFDYLMRCKRSYQKNLFDKTKTKDLVEIETGCDSSISKSKRMMDVWTKKSIEYYRKKANGTATIKTDVRFLSDNEYYSLRLSKQDLLLCSDYAKKVSGYKQYIK